MIEQRLLAAMMEDRNVWELYERIGDKDSFSPLAKRVFGAIGEYFTTDKQVGSVEREALLERELGRLANDKHIAPLTAYFESLPRGVSVANVESDIREVHRRAVGTKLSLALANGQPESDVQKLITDYQLGDVRGRKEDGKDSLVDVLDVADLLDEEKASVDYIRLWPKALNDRLDGGALRGHHVLVFARPEAGKTAFSINLVAGFLNQRLNVLYVGNEEPVADIRDRIRARLLGTSKASVRGSPRESAKRLAELGLGSVRVLASSNFQDVRKALEASMCASVDAGLGGGAFRYSVVILDQVRNMRLKADGRTAELEAAGIEARAIAKEFNVLVVSVTQAGDSATNRVYLTMSDVDSSKTGLPASADLMIGIGSDEAMKANGLMGLSLPKNKLSGSHESFTCSVNFSTGVIE